VVDEGVKVVGTQILETEKKTVKKEYFSKSTGFTGLFLGIYLEKARVAKVSAYTSKMTEQYMPLPSRVGPILASEFVFTEPIVHSENGIMKQINIQLRLGANIVGNMEIQVGIAGAPTDIKILLTSHPDLPMVSSKGYVESRLIYHARSMYEDLFEDDIRTIHVSMIVPAGVLDNGLNMQYEPHGFRDAVYLAYYVNDYTKNVILQFVHPGSTRYLAGIWTYEYDGRTVAHMTFREYPFDEAGKRDDSSVESDDDTHV